MFSNLTPELEPLAAINSTSTVQSPNCASVDRFTPFSGLTSSSPGAVTTSFPGSLGSRAALPYCQWLVPLPTIFQPERSLPFKSEIDLSAADAAKASNAKDTARPARSVGFISWKLQTRL